MLAEISSLLDEKQYNIVVIECEDLISPSFLQLCIVDCALVFTRTMASKMMIRLSEKLKFLPLSQLLPNGFISDKDDTFLARLLEEINMVVEKDDKKVFIIFDSLTVLCGFTSTVSHIPAFIRCLQQFNKNLEIKLVVTFQSKDQISNIILHESDIIMKIKRIGNGFAKDVTGQLHIMERSGETPYVENIFNYHLSDRSARLFLPGMSRPEL